MNDTLSFVDIETTGTHGRFDRIIEIGIVRLKKNKILDSFSTLVNPQTYLDPFITSMTGITAAELENAPTFYDIKDQVKELLNDTVFVAHNVRFDYGFIKNEFKRFDQSFSSRHFCTVKLARTLFPDMGRFNLDSVISYFNLRIKHRHRALDDAQAIRKFYQLAQKRVDKNTFEKALGLVLKRPTVPINLQLSDLDSLPESPGVYIFYGVDGAPIYIGKSISIRNRVFSHFSSDHLSAKEMKLSQQVRSIDTMTTAGELGALLLESQLIKVHQPIYNRALRQSRQLIAIQKHTTKDGYHTITKALLDTIEATDLDRIIAIYRSEKQSKDSLYALAEEYQLCPKLLGLEKATKSCFAYQLGKCSGACVGGEHTLKYNLRFDDAFYKYKIRRWPFQGPVIISEIGDKQEYFLIDNWCYLGRLDEADPTSVSTSKPYSFDYDAYKILVRYILDEKNVKNIKILANADASLGNRRKGGTDYESIVV